MRVFMVERTLHTNDCTAFRQWIERRGGSIKEPEEYYTEYFRAQRTGKGSEEIEQYWVCSDGSIFRQVMIVSPDSECESLEEALTEGGELYEYVYLLSLPIIDTSCPPRIIKGPNYAALKAAMENPAGLNVRLATWPAYLKWTERYKRGAERLRREQEERNAK